MEGKVYAQVYSLIRAEHDGLIDALHEFSKVGYDGVEIVSANTEPEYVGYQLDTGWAARAGADVIKYIEKNLGRFPLIHVKECTRTAATEEEYEHFPKALTNKIQRDEHGTPIFTEEIKAQLYETRNGNKGLGQGMIDWKKLVEVADAQGCAAYISEREYYHFEGSDGTASCCVKLDYDYLRNL